MAFGKVLKILPPESFMQIRKATEMVIERPLKILYPLTTICLLVWVVSAVNSEKLRSELLLLSIILLLSDLLLAVKVSIPLNKQITRIEDSHTSEAVAAKRKWIRFIVIRAYLSVTGFIFLLIYLIV